MSTSNSTTNVSPTHNQDRNIPPPNPDFLRDLTIEASEASIRIDKIKLELDYLMRVPKPSYEQLAQIRLHCLTITDLTQTLYYWAARMQSGL